MAARRAGARSQADYMRPEEIGSAKGRSLLLVRALLDGVAYCYLMTLLAIDDEVIRTLYAEPAASAHAR